MPRRWTLLLLAALAGCTVAGTRPARETRPGGAPMQLDPTGAFDPANVGTIAVLDVILPEAGAPIGDQFAGAQFAQRVGRLYMNDALRRSWAAAARRDADSVLRRAGYPVRAVGAPTSDAVRAEGVRFGLSATVVGLSLRTAGRTAPMRVEATASVAWELLDFAGGRSLLGRQLEGAARTTDSLDQAALLAIRRTLEALIADTLFHQALRTEQPELDAMVFGAGYVRSLPGPLDTVVLGAEDVNVVPADDPMVRVAAATVAFRARDGTVASGFIVARDGLAVTVSTVVRPGENRLWARFPNGVQRTARIVRERGRLALVQVACADPCRTVDLGVTGWPASGTALMAVGAPFAQDDAFVTASGREGGRCGILSGGLRALDLDGETAGGEPVARLDDGTVVGVVTRPGCATRLDDALRTLGIRLAVR